mmetsp:Transcript_3521/g.11808  ORF Transcript_3521/g.11808 Transcript_3521/m.11808 type:complete len:361 (-) Transcript_3521:1506-2588(-)
MYSSLASQRDSLNTNNQKMSTALARAIHAVVAQKSTRDIDHVRRRRVATHHHRCRRRRSGVDARASSTTPEALKDVKVGFIGAGAMAEAIARGFTSPTRGVLDASRVYAYVGPRGRASPRTEVWEQSLGARVVDEARDVAEACDVIILAVKPHMIEHSCQELKKVIDVDRHLVVSVAAGVSAASIERWLGSHHAARVVRVMPNTPCAVNEAASGVAAGDKATESDMALVCALMESCGIVEVVPEKLIDAVVGVSGSGPAYVFQVIEAMADGGVLNGLNRDVAMRLAAQTVMGAAKMVLETGEHPGALKDKVCSPNGTTIRAVAALERGGVRAAFIDAVCASTNRSIELGAEQRSSHTAKK